MKKLLGIISALLGIIILFALFIYTSIGVSFLEAIICAGLIVIQVFAFIGFVYNLFVWIMFG